MGPVILGVILGPIMEDNYRRAMQDVQHSIPLFFWEFVSNPLTLALIIVTVVMVGSQAGWWDKLKKAFFKKVSVQADKS
jgi:putative tricarboxylic transport membrane protein